MHHVPSTHGGEKRSPRSAPPAPHLSGWRFAAVDTAARAGIERFIFDAYHSAYGARITTFMPHLAALYRDEELLAACGLRSAAYEPLFLEAYLGRPVEEVLGGVTCTRARRDEIVEVGNLAIARPGAARMLIELLTAHLHLRSERWVVFTAVPVLRNNFQRLHIPLHVLGDARPENLTLEARQQWGRYYDCSPQVSAVRVEDAAAALGIVR